MSIPILKHYEEIKDIWFGYQTCLSSTLISQQMVEAINDFQWIKAREVSGKNYFLTITSKYPLSKESWQENTGISLAIFSNKASLWNGELVNFLKLNLLTDANMKLSVKKANSFKKKTCLKLLC